MYILALITFALLTPTQKRLICNISTIKKPENNSISNNKDLYGQYCIYHIVVDILSTEGKALTALENLEEILTRFCLLFVIECEYIFKKNANFICFLQYIQILNAIEIEKFIKEYLRSRNQIRLRDKNP